MSPRNWTTNARSDASRSRRGALPCSIGIALVVAVLAGCDPPGKPNPADRPVTPENVLEFATLFKQNCAGCHGADGELGPAPPLRDSLFRASVPNAEVERVITVGRPGTPMPAFAAPNGGALSALQIQVMVYAIKGIPYKVVGEGTQRKVEPSREAAGIVPQWGAPVAVAKNAPLYLAPPSKSIPTRAQSEEILTTTFVRACSGCHGTHGQGGDAGGRINDPSFLALISDQELRRVILTGRSDLGMPDYAGTDGRDPEFKPLTSEEIANLVSLLAYWRTGGGAETQQANGK
jgi:mono/diheme cytochrome c family protein